MKPVEIKQVNGQPAKRIRKKHVITRCPHTEQDHYAKGMCNHCYHLYGRSTLATKCPHTEKLTYAKGLCQNCYFNSYNKEKKDEIKHQKQKEEAKNKRRKK